MKTSLFFIIFLFGFLTVSTAQSVNQYKYVQVPEKYEFLEENEYLLNALTAFLFEKHGFNVLYKEGIPANTKPCEVLKANVVNESNFFRTKVLVTLEDCYDNVVFTSEEGKSNEKDYKRSFHDALRDAFTSIEELDYAYEAPSEETEGTGAITFAVEAPENVENPEKLEIVEEGKALEEIDDSEAGSKKFFQNGNSEYWLQKTTTGFDLFKENKEEKFATLMKSGAGNSYIYSSQNLQATAYFDEAGNLMVEYISPQTGQLVTLEYKLQE